MRRVANAIEGAAPNRPAKVFGFSISDRAAKLETTNPPSRNRTNISSPKSLPSCNRFGHPRLVFHFRVTTSTRAPIITFDSTGGPGARNRYACPRRFPSMAPNAMVGVNSPPRAPPPGQPVVAKSFDMSRTDPFNSTPQIKTAQGRRSAGAAAFAWIFPMFSKV